MSPVMEVDSPVLNAAGALVARFTFSDGESREAVISSNHPMVDDGTPWHAVALPLAMRRGSAFRIAGGVDEVALRNGVEVQTVFSRWHPDSMRRVSVQADGIVGTERSSGVGCFFSGGVDSFYSVLSHLDEITHLIFVIGFDIETSNEALAASALAGARAAASALGKELIEVTTGIRTLAEDTLQWGTHFHGAALAAVALVHAEVVGRVIVPSSYHRDDLFPWGSHPDLDHWWSSSRVTIEHDGVDVTRPEKVRFIAQFQVALDHLRVCWENPDNSYNCGRCEKCVRTMINLRSVDALRRSKTLPTALDLKRVRGLRLSHGSAIFAQENLRELEKLPERDLDLEWALRSAMEARGRRSIPGRVRRYLFRKDSRG